MNNRKRIMSEFIKENSINLSKNIKIFSRIYNMSNRKILIMSVRVYKIVEFYDLLNNFISLMFNSLIFYQALSF